MFSERQVDYVRLLAQDLRNREIAAHLIVELTTVEGELKRIRGAIRAALNDESAVRTRHALVQYCEDWIREADQRDKEQETTLRGSESADSELANQQQAGRQSEAAAAGLGRGAHLANPASVPPDTNEGSKYVPPRLRSAVTKKLAEHYETSDAFRAVAAMEGKVLRRGGRTYPVVVFPARDNQPLESVLPRTNVDARIEATIKEGDVAIREPRPRLLRWIAGHPGATLIDADRETALGWNLCMTDLQRTEGRLTLTARLAEYGLILDSCDALIDEAFSGVSAGDPVPAMPLRQAVEEAEGNPLVRAHKRAAGIGIAAVICCVARYPDGTPRLDVVIGRRSHTVGTYPDTWHVAPAGMFNWRFDADEPDGIAQRPWGAYDEGDLLRSVLTEYGEETRNIRKLEKNRRREYLEALDVTRELRAVARFEFTGVAMDLANLRPEICVLIYVADPAWSARQEWELNYEYGEHGPPTGRRDGAPGPDLTRITVAVGREALNGAALNRLDPEETVAAGAAAFWLGVERARELFWRELAAR